MDPSPGLETLKLLLLPTRLLALAAWSVVTQRDTRCYGRAVEFLEVVNRSVPRLVNYRHFAKLVLGLRAKVILGMFLDDSSPTDIRAELNRLFPEDAPVNKFATARELQKVSQIQQLFRELVFKLLSDPPFRISFLQGDIQEHYGEEFLCMLRKLLWEYLQRLDETLPRVQFEQAAQATGSFEPRQVQFLIGRLKELDSRSLQLLVADPEASELQDGVSLDVPTEEEPDGDFRDVGGLALPPACRPGGLQNAPASRRLSGGHQWLPSAPEGPAEGGEDAERHPAPVRGPRRRSSRLSCIGAETAGRSCHGGQVPDCPSRRCSLHSDPGAAEFQHVLRLQPLVLMEKLRDGGQEVRVPPPSSCGRAVARKRPTSGEGDLHDRATSEPAELPRPPRAKRSSGRHRQDIHRARNGVGDRLPRERRSPPVSSPCHKEKENRVDSGLFCPTRRHLDVGGPGEKLVAAAHPGISPIRPHRAELADVISDSEDESRDPLTACLGGKRPLQLYQRTKYDTYIPTLVQHLRPLAMHPCYIALERLPRPAVS